MHTIEYLNGILDLKMSSSNRHVLMVQYVGDLPWLGLKASSKKSKHKAISSRSAGERRSEFCRVESGERSAKRPRPGVKQETSDEEL